MSKKAKLTALVVVIAVALISVVLMNAYPRNVSTCGDGMCAELRGEDANTCPSDCNWANGSLVKDYTERTISTTEVLLVFAIAVVALLAIYKIRKSK